MIGKNYMKKFNGNSYYTASDFESRSDVIAFWRNHYASKNGIKGSHYIYATVIEEWHRTWRKMLHLFDYNIEAIENVINLGAMGCPERNRKKLIQKFKDELFNMTIEKNYKDSDGTIPRTVTTLLNE